MAIIHCGHHGIGDGVFCEICSAPLMLIAPDAATPTYNIFHAWFDKWEAVLGSYQLDPSGVLAWMNSPGVEQMELHATRLEFFLGAVIPVPDNRLRIVTWQQFRWGSSRWYVGREISGGPTVIPMPGGLE